MAPRYDRPGPATIELRVSRALAAIVVTLALGALVGRATAGSSSPAPIPETAEQDTLEQAGASHDPLGAAAVAANGSAALASAVASGSGQVGEAAERVGTPSYAARVQDAAAEHTALPGGGSALFRTVPISYRVLAYSPEQASVRLWSASVLALDETSPGAASFKTATVVVRWQTGGWRIADVRDAAPGPTPATPAASSGAEFVTTLGGMRGFHVQP
jgi:hypothetical protein